MIPRQGQIAKMVALAGAFCALSPSGIAHAQGILIVTPGTPTLSGGLFTYSYTVSYTPPPTAPAGSSFDLGFVEFAASPGAAIANETASNGFLISVDPGTEDIVFAEGSDPTVTFANSTPNFTFTSPFGPMATQYAGTDTDLNGVSGTSYNYTGTLLAPAPEPSASVAVGAGALVLTFLVAHRRRRVTTSAL